jgi:hypothetical protein
MVTDISSNIAFYPDNVAFIEPFISRYEKDLKRTQKVAEVGFAYMGEFDEFALEFDYVYSKIYRDEHLSQNNDNHTIEMVISGVVGRDFLVYVGGKMMLSQFNTDLPYLYNEYTASQFDKKYGFAQLGLVYSY